MVKKILFGTIILFVVAFVVSASNTTFARSSYMVQSGRNSTPAFQPSRTRIGFGFNGIPFDGSHRAATQMRRAARGR